MKIRSVASEPYFPKVNEKADAGDEGFSRQSPDHHEKREDEKEGRKEPIQVTDEGVLSAMEGFRREIEADRKGLVAESKGSGPGLRVVLKDGSGAVIRQWTGEEFLELRKAVTTKSGTGKILDQKL